MLTRHSVQKLASKRLIDDISVLAVECRLISRLPFIFQSDAVFELDDDETLRLAGESEYSASERRRIKEKLAVLEGSKAELRRLNVHHSPACPSSSPYEDTITEDSTQTLNEVEVEDIDSGKMTADQTQDGQVDAETHVDSSHNNVPPESYHPDDIGYGLSPQDAVDYLPNTCTPVRKKKKKNKKERVADDRQCGQRLDLGDFTHQSSHLPGDID